MIITNRNGRRSSVFWGEDASMRLDGLIKSLSEDERKLLRALEVEEFAESVKFEKEIREHYYAYEPVSIEQFIEDPYYIGESCETLYPALKKDVIDLFSRPYQEVLLTGSIGCGKTYLAKIAICRVLYELSCLINPQRALGLATGTEILIPLISRNLVLARDVIKSSVDDTIRLSPYFMTKFAPDIKKEYSKFPNGVKVVIGSYTSERVLGSNMYSAIMDETNFPPRRSAQQIETGFGQRRSIANYDIVEKVYRTLVRRVKSRFQRAGGGFSGMIILVSSAATVDSFTERKMRESKEDPHIFVRDNTQWTAKPEGTFCGEKFYILCSTSSLKSRILKEDEYEMITDEFLEENDYWIVDVPIEFREDFESDMENAMRDIAGISTQAISAYIQRPQKVLECVDEREHPFTRAEWIAGGPGGFDWDLMVNEAERRLPGGYMEKVWSPKINPSKMRWCHIDTSLSGDSTGFCVGHIDKWVEVLRRGAGGDRYTDIAPYYIIDFMLRINPPPSEQIYMPDLRMLVYQLQEKGYKFLGLSTDSYQYAEMHQQIKRKGITPHLISMDTTTDKYDELKSAIYENRIKFYKYQPFLDELKLLEYDRVVGRIDHPVGGEKDTSDAVAGVVWGLKENMSRLPMGSEMGEAVERHVSKHGWVSNLVAADSEEAKEIVGEKSSGNVEFMPIILGD